MDIKNDIYVHIIVIVCCGIFFGSIGLKLMVWFLLGIIVIVILYNNVHLGGSNLLMVLCSPNGIWYRKNHFPIWLQG